MKLFKKYRGFVLTMCFLLVGQLAYSHVTRIRVKQNQNGSLTWYVETYHGVSQCGISNSGISINGVQYPLQAEYSGAAPAAGTVEFANAGWGQNIRSYAVINTPYIPGSLNVQPYSTNVCWAFSVGGNGSFTPPPPPVCTSFPLTSASSTVVSTSDNGTSCNLSDDTSVVNLTANHLACGNITGDKKFKAFLDSNGSSVYLGEFNYSQGISTPLGSATINSGQSYNLRLEDNDFAGDVFNYSVPLFVGVTESTPPTIVLNGASSATVAVNGTYNDPGATASDNCGSAIVNVSGIVNYSIPGGYTLTYTAVDPSGNVSAPVYRTINVVPILAQAKDITVQLDANGNATIQPGDLDDGSILGGGSLSLDESTFDCSNLGVNEVTLTVTSSNGSTSVSDTANVTVQDNIAPKSILVSNNTTINLPAGRSYGWNPWVHNFNLPIPSNANVTGVAMNFAAVDQGWGGTGASARFEIAGQTIGSAQLFHDQRNYAINYNGPIAGYNNNGSNQLKMFFQGYPGWVAYFRGGTMTISYSSEGQANNVTVYLDENGNASVNLDDVDPGITDNCGVDSRSLSQSNFDCSNIGDNNIILTVTDASGNRSDFSSVITVLDSLKPIVGTNDISIDLDENGNAFITTDMINNNSSDACGIKTIELDNTSFSCANVGVNEVTLTVTDNNNNVSTATANVTVKDVTDPVVLTTDVIIELDANGSASISTDMINNGSSDACGIKTIELDNTSFSCANVGVNEVTLTVTDNNDNISTATANVTVNDIIAPTVETQVATVTLANGEATITTSDVDGGSFDNCSFTLSLDNDRFTCSDIGENTVTLTATDASGNTSSKTAIVNVVGDIPTISINDFNAVQTQKKNTIFLGFGPQSINLSTVTSGGSGFTYEWTTSTGEVVSNEANPSISPEVSTTYNVTVTNSNGCTASTSIYVCVIDARAFDKKGRYKGKVVVCHHTSGKKGTKHVEISISSSAVMTHLTKHGVGTDHADSLGGCNAVCVNNYSSKSIVNTVQESSISENISVYPVPSRGVFDIRLTNVSLRTDFLLFDTTGKLIERKTISAGNSSDNIITIGNYNLSSGIYLLKVINQNESYNRKIIVSKD